MRTKDEINLLFDNELTNQKCVGLLKAVHVGFGLANSEYADIFHLNWRGASGGIKKQLINHTVSYSIYHWCEETNTDYTIVTNGASYKSILVKISPFLMTPHSVRNPKSLPRKAKIRRDLKQQQLPFVEKSFKNLAQFSPGDVYANLTYSGEGFAPQHVSIGVTSPQNKEWWVLRELSDLKVYQTPVEDIQNEVKIQLKQIKSSNPIASE